MSLSNGITGTDAPESNRQRYGVRKRILSNGERRDRVYTDVKDLHKMEGQTVWVRGRLQASWATGPVWSALLRQGGTVRLTLNGDRFSQGMLEFATSVTEESIVDVFASVVRPSVGQEVELRGEELWTVSAARALPFRIEEGSDTENHVDLDTRLDNRALDLRSSVNQAIFRVVAGVLRLFRESLTSKGFIEICTPKIMQGILYPNNSNTEAYHVPMANSTVPCNLAVSMYPHKQMAINGDFDKVFSTGPIFRKEKESDKRHLIEFQRLDFMMTYKQHYHEALEVVEQTFLDLFRGLEDQYASEIATVAQQYKVEPFKFSDPPPRLEFTQAVQMLKEAGVTKSSEQDDLSPSDERALGELVRARYDTDFFVVDKFPPQTRPFYAKYDRHPEAGNSYDMYMRGVEVLSGSEVISDYDLLFKRAKEERIDVGKVSYYFDAFKYGCPPHATAAMGLERIVTQYLGLGDIRKAAMFPRDVKRLAP